MVTAFRSDEMSRRVWNIISANPLQKKLNMLHHQQCFSDSKTSFHHCYCTTQNAFCLLNFNIYTFMWISIEFYIGTLPSHYQEVRMIFPIEI